MSHSATKAALSYLLLALSLVLLSGPAQVSAAPADFFWLEDADDRLTARQVMALDSGQWQAFDEDEVLNLGFSDGAFWLKARVPPQPQNRVLEIRYPLLDVVDVFWVVDGEIVRRYETGDSRPFASRPLYHRNFVFLVPSNTETATAYVRVKTQGAVQIPVEVLPSAEFLAGEQLSYGWQAMFLGIIVALGLYNLFLFTIVRQVTYLWYVLTVVSSGLVHLHFHGLLFQWWWPDLPILNRYFTVPIIGLAMMAAIMFSLQFLAVARYSRFCYRFLMALMIGSGLSVVYGLFGPYQSGIALVAVLAAIATPAGWLIGLYVWFRGQALAGFYVLAWTPLLLGHLILAISKLGYLPRSFLTEFGPQIGVALEVILLAFALAHRINLERRRRLKAQEQALTIQRQANQTLEERVRERTEELERANQRLKSISFTDGLTQIPNRRQFDERIRDEWARTARQGQPLSLLLLDIDHFKSVNDRYGHLVGDDCLITVAAICAHEIQRSGDLLARFGGEEFAVLLPATPETGALQVAERLRRAIENATVYPGAQEAAVSLSVSVGVATMIPPLEKRPDELIQRADEALYEAKGAGRNRVMAYRGARATSADQS
ncbi:sensor domain-containing diguanylate cyclase [Marinobacter arenosus]|uniref:sensor domain-containing diguanylate cyclase n=1 Tax=Marinobacter arenosus TaxID=2856822 RepID=UPI001C4CC899|nr:diguanylate cyclase [Marinobacter arenosus]MBW0148149.1 sensor domain-containing diguanylate cyclase [Marinobacter arenosus]